MRVNQSSFRVLFINASKSDINDGILAQNRKDTLGTNIVNSSEGISLLNDNVAGNHGEEISLRLNRNNNDKIELTSLI